MAVIPNESGALRLDLEELGWRIPLVRNRQALPSFLTQALNDAGYGVRLEQLEVEFHGSGGTVIRGPGEWECEIDAQSYTVYIVHRERKQAVVMAALAVVAIEREWYGDTR